MANVHDLHNASFDYVTTSQGREIVFNDPFFKTRLDPARVPPSIARSPHLRDGINRLAYYGNSGHHLTIGGASHNEKAQFNLEEARDLIADNDVIFLEGIGHDAADRSMVQQIANGRSDLPEKFVARWGQYKALQMAAILGSRKAVYYADIPSDGTPYETELSRWGSLARGFTATARATSGEDRRKLYRAALINMAGSTILREWQMIGTIGNNLADAGQRGYDVNRSLFLAGTEHGNTLPNKLGILGVSSSSVELTMHIQGEADLIEVVEFDFTTAVRDYRARIN